MACRRTGRDESSSRARMKREESMLLRTSVLQTSAVGHRSRVRRGRVRRGGDAESVRRLSAAGGFAFRKPCAIGSRAKYYRQRLWKAELRRLVWGAGNSLRRPPRPGSPRRAPLALLASINLNAGGRGGRSVLICFFSASEEELQVVVRDCTNYERSSGTLRRTKWWQSSLSSGFLRSTCACTWCCKVRRRADVHPLIWRRREWCTTTLFEWQVCCELCSLCLCSACISPDNGRS